MSTLEELERLGRLKADGLLTDDEFNVQKARILAAPRMQPQPTASAQEAPEPAVPEPEFYWNPLRPVQTEADALALCKYGVGATAAMVTSDIVGMFIEARRGYDQLGQELGMPGSEAFAYSAGATALVALLLGLITWVTIARKSRAAAILLMAIAGLYLLGSILDFETTRAAGVVLSGLALLLAIQPVRGAFAFHQFRRPGVPAPGPATTATEALSRGLEASRPIRQLIQWTGAFVLVLFLAVAAFVWFDRDPAATEPAGTALAAQPAVGTQASTQAGQTEWLTQYLTGIWAPEGAVCDSGAPFALDADGNYRAEGEYGRWRVEGLMLVIDAQAATLDEVTGEDRLGPVVATTHSVSWTGANEITVARPGQPAERYRRCDGQNMEPWGRTN